MISLLSFIPGHFYRRPLFQQFNLIQMHASVSYSMHLNIKHGPTSFIFPSVNYSIDSICPSPSISSIVPSIAPTSTSRFSSTVHPSDSIDSSDLSTTSTSPSSSSSYLTSSPFTVSSHVPNSIPISKDVDPTPSLNQENTTFSSDPSCSFTSSSSRSSCNKKASSRIKLKKRKNNIPSSPFISLSPFCAPYQPPQPPSIHSFSDGQGVPRRELISYLWKLFLTKDHVSLRSFIASCFSHPSFLATPLNQFTSQDWAFFLYACFLAHRFSDMHRLWMTYTIPWSSFILNVMLASYVRSHLTNEVFHLFHQIRERRIHMNEAMLLFVSMVYLPTISLQRKCRTLINHSLDSLFSTGRLDPNVIHSIADPVLAVELQKCFGQVTDLFAKDPFSPEKIKNHLKKIVNTKESKTNVKRHRN